MKASQKLLIELSEKRERLALLGAKTEALSDVEDRERKEILDRIPKAEVEYRAAVEGETERVPSPQAAETAEFRSLVGRVQLTRYLAAAVDGRPLTDGAEVELRSELDLPDDEIPWLAVAPRTEERDRRGTEERADVVTPAPGTTANQIDSALGRVFANSVAAFLGVRFPSVAQGTAVYPVLSGGVTPAPKSKGDDTDSAAGAYSVKSVSPTRVSARFSFAVEDLAMYAPLEDDLRRDMSMALSTELDKQIVVGGAAAPNFTGSFLQATTDPTNPTDVVTAQTALDDVAAHLDGLYARAFGDIRLVFGPDTTRKLATLFRSANVSETALDLINRLIGAGNIRTTAHIPAPASSIQKYLARRGSEMSAVAPAWGGVRVVRDAQTGVGKGEVYVTSYALMGFGVVRGDSYAQGEFKIA